ncbi:hypothetical protein BASA81_004143 [Batrachochytrium salamandrivorans]|nr:hypothetical protein BASA81_004143 [Batrachochytrium salamandrivorans]
MPGNHYAAQSGSGCACLAFVLLIFATVSPWIMYSTYYGQNGTFASYGVGPFVAGASTGAFASPPLQYYAGVVWWSDLNTANACRENSSLYIQWSEPHNMCPNGEFQIPPQSQAIQACTVLATIFAFFTMVAGFGLGKSKATGSTGAAVCGLLATLFAICSFSLWTTWSLAQDLRNQQGDFVPLYATLDGGKVITLEPSPRRVTMFYGWTFITTVVSFVMLLFATMVFALQTKQAHDEGEFGGGGGFGSGTGIGVI